MKLIHLVLCSVFVGVSFGKKLECLNKKFSTCMLGVYNSSLPKETDKCLIPSTLFDCFESSAKLCPKEGQQAIKNLVEMGRQLCDENSQMFKDFKNYGGCIGKPTFEANVLIHCLMEFKEFFGQLGKPDLTNMQEYADKVMAFVCPKRETVVNCAYGQMRAECGEPAEKFYRKLTGPLNELVKESCDSASIPSISLALVFLQLAIAVFSYRKIF